jgi:hypothetical protein
MRKKITNMRAQEITNFRRRIDEQMRIRKESDTFKLVNW